ncbi:MFS transporter [Emcibacter sp.]|uniref:MFS transporter n=1 Tax=Emcibacter sp. TaxID=1979954 RepID=UPI002AA5E8F2|nr:MFS transporter [Emcibacter sp.]
MSTVKPSSGEQPVKLLHVTTVLFCFIFNMLDGADVLLVAYAAPYFSEHWSVSPQSLGLIFSAGLVGMTIGALFIAPFADVFGRKTTILLSTSIIAVGMILSSLAPNVETFIGLRVFVGLGIGSMLASVTALASEYAPPRYRNLAVTIATSGYALGAVVAGVVAVNIIPLVGWQGLFLYAGVVSAIMLPLSLFFMPESTEFLLARQPRRALERVNRVYSATALPPLSTLPPQIEDTKKVPGFTKLLSPTYRRDTLLLWGAFFCAFMTLYFLTSWVPKIAVDAGLPKEKAIYAGATFNFGAFVGLLLLGWIAARLSLNMLIAVFFGIATLVMVLFGAVHTPIELFFVEIFSIGFLVQGGFGGLYAAAARQYPATIRTTGVGWALGAGRFGAVFGPYLGGLTIGWGVGLLGNFIIFAIPIGAAGLIMLFLKGEQAEAGA